jgi:hypothetical protein
MEEAEAIDELRVDMVERAIDVEAWTLGGPGHLLADTSVNSLADHIALTWIDHDFPS